MANETRDPKYRLTGNFGFRRGFGGTQVLRVEYCQLTKHYSVDGCWTAWRDATADDISILRTMGKL